jgi:23S rRNA (adenine2503-C2)-methyltransferase
LYFYKQKQQNITHMKKNIKSHSKNYLNAQANTDLKSWLKDNKFPAYRSDQIFKWIFAKWVTDPAEMKNIPAPLREKLADDFLCNTVKIIGCKESSDGTKKLLLSLADKEAVESVIIPSENRITFCLSSQVGCAVQCKFCASGANGLIRNLHAGEIIEQLLLCCQEAGAKPDNIVFMGVGEPLMNFHQMITALEIITDPEKFAMAQRRITVSTSGWTKGMKKLAMAEKQFNLAVSLHGPDNATRARLIPSKNRRPIKEIMEACTFYREKTGRMVTFEYTLIDGVNSSTKQAEKLAKLATEHRCKINLIPFNQIPSSDFKSPSKDAIRHFQHILTVHGAQVTRRVKKGDSVDAACGQLRASKGK